MSLNSMSKSFYSNLGSHETSFEYFEIGNQRTPDGGERSDQKEARC